MNLEIKSDDVALVDSVLRRDPGNSYAAMDALSRDQYLDTAIQFARRGNIAPLTVAETALTFAEAKSTDPRRGHIGYYLISDGRFELMAMLGIRFTFSENIQRLADRSRLALYMSCIGVFSLGATVLWMSLASIPMSGLMGLVAGMVCFTAATHLGVHGTNQCVRLLFPPKRLPRLEFADGLPDAFRTLVAVPCMLTSPGAIRDLAHGLELLYLGNADRNLGFCLVSDFLDADREFLQGDADLLETAITEIESLNSRYGGGFVLMHRKRIWNAHEGAWMGWERKRGKLEDLNAALVGQDLDSHFSRIVGDTNKLDLVRFVITLDDDMGLQAGDARRMIGTLAHPLNMPEIAVDGSRVECGYGLLQPSLHAVARDEQMTRYESLYGTVALSAGASGIKASVYQDLFEQASYCGKGIYDVHAFYRVLHRRFPENLVLSHDMLEGSFIRAGLVSDIVMLEDLPPTYLSSMQRRHRWLRGDWQTVPWLLPKVPGGGGDWITNQISPLGVWLTIDNVRRILAPVAQLAALLVGLAYSARPGISALATVGMTVLPVLSALCLHFWLNGRKTSIAIMSTLAYRWLSATLLNITFVVYESKIALDAIFRSSYRMIVSKRSLLEWVPQSIVNHQREGSLSRHYLRMWPSAILAIATIAALLLVRPSALPAAAPFLALWVLAPAIAWWLGRSARPT